MLKKEKRDAEKERREKIMKNITNTIAKLPVAGRPTANYRRGFSYLNNCLPEGPKVDSSRSNGSDASAKTRQFMMSLELKDAIKASKTRSQHSHLDMVTKPYSLH